MASFYPSLEEIQNDKMERHTEGELALLKELGKLSDDFYVYFQPHINFAHPDIIILHKTGGAMIIEVKDWNLSSYSFWRNSEQDEYGFLRPAGKTTEITSPFKQAKNYKDDLFKLCSGLTGEKIRLGSRGKNIYGTIKTAVYFHNATAGAAAKLFGPSGRLSLRDGVKKYSTYTSYWCREDLQNIASDVCRLMRPHWYFTQPLYDAMQALFAPSDAWAEQMTPFDLGNLDPRQKNFARCVPGSWTRVKGVAGSGKSMIVAQKAINCYKQKKTPVLILTYNITLRNYLRDRIAQNTRDMSQRERGRAFKIIHFDEFLPQMLRDMDLEPPYPNNFINQTEYNMNKYAYDTTGVQLNGSMKYPYPQDFIDWDMYYKAFWRKLEREQDRVAERGHKYETVLIDEAQDYKRIWYELIQKFFLADNAELFVVADEKQNIHERELENKLPVVPNFKSPWRRLTKSYRFSRAVFTTASDFQATFMENKYEHDLNETPNASAKEGSIRYFCLTSGSDNFGKIWEIINQRKTDRKPVSPNDICVLFNDISSIRALEQKILTSAPGVEVETMCETQDEYNKLRERKRQGEISDYGFKNELENTRRPRKKNFNMNSGTIKICTIHSFKGWEIDTVVLVLGNVVPYGRPVNDELIYTAITRAKQNVIVINFGNEKYHDFFAAHDTSNRK